MHQLDKLDEGNTIGDCVMGKSLPNQSVMCW